MSKIKKAKPMHNRLIVTMERYAVDEVKGSLIDAARTQGTIKEIQKVISIGTTVRDIKEGDYVKINPSRYAVKKISDDSLRSEIVTNDVIKYNIPTIEIEDNTYMVVFDSDVEYIVEEYDDTPESTLIHIEPKLIV